MTKEELKKALEKAIEDEAQAIKGYNHLADEMQTWVNTMPFYEQKDWQFIVAAVRFIAGDEARHLTDLEELAHRLTAG